MIKKLKGLLAEFRNRNEVIMSQNAELIWANIFHDTICDREWLKNLSISPGRWAGGYSMFYTLVRILSDYQPVKVIEFGLGESSKIISAFLDNSLHHSQHIVLEHDPNWIDVFQNRFKLSERSSVKNLSLTKKEVNGFVVNSYSGIETIKDVFDLYVVDGPFGSPQYSRFDILHLAAQLNTTNDFIILIDDYNRDGEKETIAAVINELKGKGIEIFTGIYSGEKSQFIIATEKYRFITSV